MTELVSSYLQQTDVYTPDIRRNPSKSGSTATVDTAKQTAEPKSRPSRPEIAIPSYIGDEAATVSISKEGRILSGLSINFSAAFITGKSFNVADGIKTLETAVTATTAKTDGTSDKTAIKTAPSADVEQKDSSGLDEAAREYSNMKDEIERTYKDDATKKRLYLMALDTAYNAYMAKNGGLW